MSFPQQTWTVIIHAQCQTSLKLGTTDDLGILQRNNEKKKKKNRQEAMKTGI